MNEEWFITLSFPFMLLGTAIGINAVCGWSNDIIGLLVSSVWLTVGFTAFYFQLRKVLPNV